jgi:hypothetical protein
LISLRATLACKELVIECVVRYGWNQHLVVKKLLKTKPTCKRGPVEHKMPISVMPGVLMMLQKGVVSQSLDMDTTNFTAHRARKASFCSFS